MAITERRKALLQYLVQIQQEVEAVDILTITGFMSDDEVAAHALRYADLVKSKRSAR